MNKSVNKCIILCVIFGMIFISSSLYSITEDDIAVMTDNNNINGLINILNSDNANESFLAAIGLINIGSNAVPSLMDNCSVDNEWARLQTVFALVNIADERSLQLILNMLINESSAEIRIEILKGINNFDEPDTILPYLLRLTGDRNSEVRIKTARALGQIGNDLAFSAVINMLGDSNDEVSRAVAVIIAGMWGNDAVPFLIASLHSSNANKRASAARALGLICDDSAIPAIEQARDNETNMRALEAYNIAINQLEECN